MELRSTLYFKTNSIFLMENGIVCFKANQDDVYEAEDLIKILDLMSELTSDKPFLLVMDVGTFDFLMTKEARNLFNTYPKALDLIIAEAVVLRSRSSRIMYNLLSRLNPPKFPFKAFNHLNEASLWLLSTSKQVA